MPTEKETLAEPMQVRLPKDLRKRIKKIAEINHLSEVAVVRYCLGHTVPAMEKNGLTILPG